jgi:hypothetical protein
MSNEKNNIDELFRGKLRDYSVEAPEHVWKGIEASRTPLHRALNYFRGKRGAIVGSVVMLATVSGIAYLTGINNTSTVQQNATAYTIQKHNNSHTIQAVNLDEAALLQANNTSQNTPESTNTNDGVINNSVSSPQNTANSVEQNATQQNSDNAQPPVVEDNIPKENTSPIDNNSTTDKTEQPSNSSPKNNTTDIEQPAITKGDETYSTPDKQPSKEEILSASADVSDNTGVDKKDEVENQNNTTVQPDKNYSKYTADIYVGGNYTMRNLKGTGADASYLDAKRNAESYTPGIVLGARVNYDIKNFLTLRVGAQYSRFNQRINLEREYNYTTIETVTGVIIDPITQQPIQTVTRTDTVEHTETARANTTNTISFVDIPVQLELNIYKTQKYSVFATTGAALNLRFTQKGHQINERITGVNEISSANSPYKTTAGMSILAGVGVNYNLNNRFSLLFETTYQHGINNVMKANAGMSQSYRIISGSVGLRYRF